MLEKILKMVTECIDCLQSMEVTQNTVNIIFNGITDGVEIEYDIYKLIEYYDIYYTYEDKTKYDNYIRYLFNRDNVQYNIKIKFDY